MLEMLDGERPVASPTDPDRVDQGECFLQFRSALTESGRLVVERGH